MKSVHEIWEVIYARLRNLYTEVIIDTWIDNLRPFEFKGDTLVLECDTDFVKQVVESRYHDDFVREAEIVMGFPVYVAIKSNEDPNAPLSKTPISPPPPPDEPPGQYSAIEGYTFPNFIVGSSNKLAHAACIAVTDTPGDAFNPLFIYGGSGLGKTHLLFAVRNQMKRKYPGCNIGYIKGEDFINELVGSIRSGTMAAFREKYRLLDCLLIDDVQFLAGKEQTQEEFFHTFNSLYEAKKQIVLTSDKPPKEIMPLEERLRSRFEWGLMADIQPPDYETRLAIINRKAQSLDLIIPSEVANFVAERLKKNIRQIEGAVKKLKAMNMLEDIAITTDAAHEVIKDILSSNIPTSVIIENINSSVSEYYGVTSQDLYSNKRNGDVLKARQVAMYLIREHTGMPYKKIGQLFGGKDHTTIMNAIKKIEKDLNTDNELKNIITEIGNSME